MEATETAVESNSKETAQGPLDVYEKTKSRILKLCTTTKLEVIWQNRRKKTEYT